MRGNGIALGHQHAVTPFAKVLSVRLACIIRHGVAVLNFANLEQAGYDDINDQSDESAYVPNLTKHGQVLLAPSLGCKHDDGQSFFDTKLYCSMEKTPDNVEAVNRFYAGRLSMRR